MKTTIYLYFFLILFASYGQNEKSGKRIFIEYYLLNNDTIAKNCTEDVNFKSYLKENDTIISMVKPVKVVKITASTAAYLSNRTFLLLNTKNYNISDRLDTESEEFENNHVIYTPLDFEIYRENIFLISGDREVGSFRLSIFDIKDNRLRLQFLSEDYMFDEFADWNFIDKYKDGIYLNVLKNQFDDFPSRLQIKKDGKKYIIQSK